MQSKQEKRHRRHKRVRSRVKGTADCPRFSVFRSNKHIYIQLIDDEEGKTLIGLNDAKLKGKEKASKIEKTKELGRLMAEKALAQGIKKVVFDRGGYKYHGRIKAAAEGAREGGLKF